MPAGDGTGPMGMGPMTGRAAGYCVGYAVPGYVNPGPRAGFGPGVGGRGFWGRGGGRGGGRGWRHWYRATGMPGWGFAPVTAPYVPSAEQETDVLKRQADFLEQQLGEIRERLTELETAQAQK